MTGFADFLNSHDVRSYLEIGARHGDTFHFLMCSLPVGSRGVAVDLPGGLWGTGKSKPHLIEAVEDLNANGYKCSYVFGNSQAEATSRLVWTRGPYDAVLIDGDHTLDGVTKDWEIYGKLAPYIAFHDIVGQGQVEKVNNNPVEVPILWDRLKAKYETREFIDTDSRMGIGVVCR